MRQRTTRRLALALIAALAIGAASATPASIVVKDLKFGPAPAHLRAGQPLIFVNRDIFEHSATADDKSFDLDLPPGKQAQIVLKRPGAYSFICKFHPGMKGRVVVSR